MGCAAALIVSFSVLLILIISTQIYQVEGNVHRRYYDSVKIDKDDDNVEREVRGACGCPFRRSACERSCRRNIGETVVGRCRGFLWATCSCSINGHWVNIADKC